MSEPDDFDIPDYQTNQTERIDATLGIVREKNKNLVGDKLQALVNKIAEQVKDQIGEAAWVACRDYVEYADYEPLSNWKSATRDELVRENYWRKDDFWGREMRRAILAEHKAELIPLLQNELIKQQQEEIEKLTESLELERRSRRY